MKKAANKRNIAAILKGKICISREKLRIEKKKSQMREIKVANLRK